MKPLSGFVAAARPRSPCTPTSEGDAEAHCEAGTQASLIETSEGVATEADTFGDLVAVAELPS